METLQPKLRFPKFKGEWTKDILGNLITIKSGQSPSTYNLKLKGINPFIKVDELNNCNKYQLISREYSDDSRGLILSNSIIFPKRGAAILNNKVRINSTNILMDSNMMALLPIKQKIYSEFLYYLITKVELYKIADTSTIPQINNKHIEPFNVNIPSIDEQTKIANFLSSIDEKLNLLKEKKALLEDYKKGIMQKIFNQELRFKDNNGNDFEKWEKVILGEISDVRDGTHDSPKYVDNGYPLITSKNLNSNGKLDFKNVEYITQLDFDKINKRSKVDIGDIIFGMIGTIGNPVLLKSNDFAIKNVALIKEKQILKNSFLIHYLNSNLILNQFNKENVGGTQKFLSLGIIRNLEILLPSITEQTKIANFLSAIDEKIELVSNQIQDTQEYKKGLLQQMFV